MQILSITSSNTVEEREKEKKINAKFFTAIAFGISVDRVEKRKRSAFKFYNVKKLLLYVIRCLI